jgi:hypothetical protein
VFQDGYKAYVEHGTGTAGMTIEMMDDSTMWDLTDPAERHQASQYIMMILARSMPQVDEMLVPGGGGRSGVKGRAPVRKQPQRRAKNPRMQAGQHSVEAEVEQDHEEGDGDKEDDMDEQAQQTEEDSALESEDEGLMDLVSDDMDETHEQEQRTEEDSTQESEVEQDHEEGDKEDDMHEQAQQTEEDSALESEDEGLMDLVSDYDMDETHE